MRNYQKRYLAHQKKKKESLSGKYVKGVSYSDDEIMSIEKVFKNRHSSRVFSGEKITDKEFKELLKLVEYSPSSCDRKGVGIVVIDDREDKEILGGVLVGGVGWINRAEKIILLYADMNAYGSLNERDFMHYLDAGVMIQSFYLSSEILGLKCCYVNPNIRSINKEFFKSRFLAHRFGAHIGINNIFCGAIILGK